MSDSRLKEERSRLKKTQSQLAEEAGTKMRTLQDWERGVSSPTVSQLSKLGAAGVDVVYVLTGARLDEATRSKISGMLDVTASCESQDMEAVTLTAVVQVAESAKLIERINSNLRRCKVEDLGIIDSLARRFIQ